MMDNKIKEFAKLLENDQLKDLFDSNMSCDTNILNCKVKITKKKKYTYIDVGDSGKYMVENSTGNIYGIKGYGKVNKYHKYGTLDTIYNYYWGEYTAIPSKENRKKHITELVNVIDILKDRGG
jgi:hypothetical protein